MFLKSSALDRCVLLVVWGDNAVWANDVLTWPANACWVLPVQVEPARWRAAVRESCNWSPLHHYFCPLGLLWSLSVSTTPLRSPAPFDPGHSLVNGDRAETQWLFTCPPVTLGGRHVPRCCRCSVTVSVHIGHGNVHPRHYYMKAGAPADSEKM